MFAAADVTTIFIALGTAVVVSILAPVVAGVVADRGKRTEAEIRKSDAQAAADLARQEREKDRVELREQADALLAAQKVQQEALLESNNRIADATINNSSKIDAIKKDTETTVHLSDGALTASLEAQLWALKSARTSRELLLAYRAGTDNEPTAEEVAAMADDDKRIVMLEAQLTARHEAMQAAMAGVVVPQPILIEQAAVTVVEAKPLEVKEVVVTDPLPPPTP